MISYSKKIIFIHIPKTGGTSIEKMFWPYSFQNNEKNLRRGFINKYHNQYQTGGLQHLTASNIKKAVGQDVFNEFSKFSVIRNPYDKIISQFSYMKKRKDLRDFIEMDINTPFKEYLALITKTEHVQWMPQYKFLFDENDQAQCDNIIHFENMNEELSMTMKKLKIDKRFIFFDRKIPHLNKSIRKTSIEDFDKETKEIIYNLYKEDFNKFGYNSNL